MARSGLFQHVDFNEGVLTPDDLNEAFKRIIENLYPEKVDDFAEDLDMFRITQNPTSNNAVVLPLNLSQEIAVIRHQLNSIIGESEWYDSPASTIKSIAASLVVAGASGSAITTSTSDPTGGAEGDLHIKVSSTSIEFYIRSTDGWPDSANSSLTIGTVTLRSGTGAVSDDTGEDGDIYLRVYQNEIEFHQRSSGSYSLIDTFTGRINDLTADTIDPSNDYIGFEDVDDTNAINKKIIFSTALKTDWMDDVDTITKTDLAARDQILIRDDSASSPAIIALEDAVSKVLPDASTTVKGIVQLAAADDLTDDTNTDVTTVADVHDIIGDSVGRTLLLKSFGTVGTTITNVDTGSLITLDAGVDIDDYSSLMFIWSTVSGATRYYRGANIIPVSLIPATRNINLQFWSSASIIMWRPANVDDNQLRFEHLTGSTIIRLHFVYGIT